MPLVDITPEQFDILARMERDRQVEELGYTVEHDFEQDDLHLVYQAYRYLQLGEEIKVAALLLAMRDLGKYIDDMDTAEYADRVSAMLSNEKEKTDEFE